MSCKVKQRALKEFEKAGAIENNVVVDFRTFDELNEEFTKLARRKYNVGTGNTNLFSVSMDTPELTVIPNDILLDALEKAVDEFNEAKKSINQFKVGRVSMDSEEDKYDKDPKEVALSNRAVYRGVSLDSQYSIDANGDLILTTQDNFNGKTQGISFTPYADTATDYATRRKDGTSKRASSTGKVIKITDVDFIKTLEGESYDELMSTKNVKIPKGKFSIENYTIEDDDSKYTKQYLLDRINKYKNYSIEQLVEQLFINDSDQEIVEFNGTWGGHAIHEDDVASRAIKDAFGGNPELIAKEIAMKYILVSKIKEQFGGDISKAKSSLKNKSTYVNTAYVNGEVPLSEIFPESLNADSIIERVNSYGIYSYKVNDVFESKINKLRDDSKSPFLSYVPVDSESYEGMDEVDFTPTTMYILFGESDTTNAAEVLRNIKDSMPSLNDNTTFLLEKVIPVLGRTNARIKFVDEKQLAAADTFMQYDASTNEIQIAKSRLKDATPEFAIQGFLHEVAHSVTAKAYLNPSTLEEQMFRDFIDEQFGKYKGMSESYGLTSPMEFLAEVISNKAFQDEMIALDKSTKGFWSKLIDFIRTLFGASKIQSFHNIIDSITTIATNADTEFSGFKQSGVFEFKKEEVEIPSLKTLEDKVNKLVRDAADNIAQAAKRVKLKGKKGEARDTALDFKAELEALKGDMDQYAQAEQFKAIILYVKSLKGTVSYLNRIVDNVDRTSPKILEFMDHYENYLDAYDMMDDINNLIDEALVGSDSLTDEQLEDVEEIDRILGTFAKDHRRLVGKIEKIRKKAVTKEIQKLELFPEVEYKWKERLRSEYDPVMAMGMSEDEWITNQMVTVHADAIQEDVKDAAESLAEDIDEDISGFEANFSDPLNANSSRIFTLAVNIVAQMRNRINQAVHDFEFELDAIFSRLKSESNVDSPSKRYAHLVEQDEDDNYYLKGKYSVEFKDAYKEYAELKRELYQLSQDAQGMGWSKADTYAAEDYKEQVALIKEWESVHMEKNKLGQLVPHSMYLNDLSKLTDAELEFLELFEEINDNNVKIFGKSSSLKFTAGPARFYKLPTVSKSNHERMIELDGKGMIKDNLKDATEIRPDDVGFREEALDGKNQPLKNVRVHYRGQIDADQQSLDLPTLLRLEHLNGVNYSEKTKSRLVLNGIAEIAREKKYIAKSERTGKWLVNLFRKNKEVADVDGAKSKTYERMQQYIDSNIYDVLNLHAGFSLAGADVNKITSMLSGYTATLGMALNFASGTVNVMNGFSQMYIEAAGKDHINLKSLQKAEGMYMRDMPNIMADYARPVKKSVTNQITQMFDTFGGFSIANQEFYKSTLAKRLASMETLSGIQNAGEHMMQSILTMAVLDGIKVMNNEGRYITKEGKVVEGKEKAASLLDMIKLDQDTGQAYVSGKVYYTTHTRNVDFHNGGHAHVSLLIKKKIHDTAGVYDSNMQPEIYRHWYGKWLLLFKRYLISQMQHRWSGFSTVHKKKEALTKSDRGFNTATKEYLEGTYVTALRLGIGNPKETMRVFYEEGVIPALKSLKLAHLPENYKKLSRYEKANLRKVTADLMIASVMIPTLTILLQSIAEDDDSEFNWFLVYLTRRLHSELTQFRNPREAWRITSNPVANTRVIQNGLDVIGDVLAPWLWLEEDSKGNNKVLKDVEKMIPVWIQFKKEWKQQYNYIENQAN